MFFDLWCEFDYGQDGVIFRSKSDALKFLQEQIDEKNPGGYDAVELEDMGLVNIRELKVYA